MSDLIIEGWGKMNLPPLPQGQEARKLIAWSGSEKAMQWKDFLASEECTSWLRRCKLENICEEAEYENSTSFQSGGLNSNDEEEGGER